MKFSTGSVGRNDGNCSNSRVPTGTQKSQATREEGSLDPGIFFVDQDCATRSFDPGSNNVHCSSSRMTFNSKELHLHMTMSPTCLSFTFESR